MSLDGTYMRPSRVAATFAAMASEAGLPKGTHFHTLRHTHATWLLSGGVDVKTVQEVLGHENLNTTQIYTHIENTELKIASEANPISKLKI